MKVLLFISCGLTIAAAQFFNPYVFQQQQFVTAAQQPAYSGQQHVPVLGPLGVPIEPKEVQQAKAAHLEILARQNARAQLDGNQQQQQQQFNNRQQFSTSVVQVQPSFAVAQNAFQVATPITQAQIRLSPNGVVQDTPEVALAKAEHFSLYAKQAEAAAKAKDTSMENRRNNKASVSVSVPLPLPIFSYNGIVGNGRPLFRKRRDLGSYGEHQHQHGIHIPIMTKSGVPLDTPEVQLARAQHMIAHYHAANQHHELPHETLVHPVIYNGPQDHYHHVPIIGPKGVPIETPEVQIARAQHLAAHAEVRARHQHHQQEAIHHPQEIDYYHHDEGQYQQQYDDGQYRPEQHEYQHYHPQQYGGEEEYYE